MGRRSSYASIKCQKTAEYRAYVERWLTNEETGANGLTVSRHVRRYLVETRGEACEECGWAARNSHTGLIPLCVDHIDGDYRNNHPSNLRLLCPNCHALTPTFGGANRGFGRRARGAARREPTDP